jgi:hypothetical protein
MEEPIHLVFKKYDSFSSVILAFLGLQIFMTSGPEMVYKYVEVNHWMNKVFPRREKFESPVRTGFTVSFVFYHCTVVMV